MIKVILPPGLALGLFWTATGVLAAPVAANSVPETAVAETPLPELSSASHYQLDLSQREQHRLAVTLRLKANKAEPIELQMANSSPGRYARHDFAKNLYALRATNQQGQPLDVTRIGPSRWRVQPDAAGIIDIQYLLFANYADGTYSQIDRRHAHLNMPATFLYAPSLAEQPVTLEVGTLPKGWSVATQLQALNTPLSYQAQNLQLFMDSPLEIAPLQRAQFNQVSNGVTYSIEVALHHQGTLDDLAQLMPKIQAFVQEQQAIFGELPAFDQQRYTFLADYLPGVHGDGMEHRNSTVVTSDESLQERDFAQVETMAHEFFHAWNVERIRPKTIEPFDFTQTNMSDALWFAEGFTNYYGKLSLKRAGYFDTEAYLAQVSKALDRTLRSPGRQWRGPKAMSEHAVFVDAGVAVDVTDYQNNYLSYYTYGEVMALVWDLELRLRFDTDLDRFMQQMWHAFGKPETPYQLSDLQQVLARVSGDEAFATMVFRDWIEKPGLPDMVALLGQFGLALTQDKRQHAWAGPLQLEPADGGLKLTAGTLAGTPWFAAGLNQDAVLLQVGRYKMKDLSALDKVLDKAKPGDQVAVHYRWQGEDYHTTLTLSGDPTWNITLDPNASKAAIKRRQAWLSSKVSAKPAGRP